jgi:hypothetical protein
MNVSLTNALNGLTLQNRRLAEAVSQVTKQTADPKSAKPNDPSLEEGLVAISLAKNGYKANAQVIKTQEKMDGELLDILA